MWCQIAEKKMLHDDGILGSPTHLDAEELLELRQAMFERVRHSFSRTPTEQSFSNHLGF